MQARDVVLYCFYKISLKIRANLKRHNRVYILSSKHTYRPMSARLVAQLFYKKRLVFSLARSVDARYVKIIPLKVKSTILNVGNVFERFSVERKNAAKRWSVQRTFGEIVKTLRFQNALIVETEPRSKIIFFLQNLNFPSKS